MLKKPISKRAIWISAISLVVAVAVVLGLVFGIKSCNTVPPVEQPKIVEQMLIFEDKQESRIGKPIAFQFYYYSDKEFTCISYSINNGVEVEMADITFGNAQDHKKYNGENASYYIDTGVQLIDTTDMLPGYYTLVFYGISKDGVRTQICSEPYIFKLIVKAV